MWRGRGVLFLSIKMSQDSIDDILFLDTGDDSDRTTAATADFDVYIEYSLESLSPGHGGMALGGCADFCVGVGLDAFPAPCWCDQPTPAVVRRQDAVVTGEVDAGFGYQGSQSGSWCSGLNKT